MKYADIIENKGLEKLFSLQVKDYATVKKIGELRRKVKELTIAYHESRNTLLQAHGEKDEKTGFHIGPAMPGWAAFVEEVNKLSSEEIDIEPISVPFKLFAEISADEFDALTGIVTLTE